MVSTPDRDTAELLHRAERGDASAVNALLDRHRDRLRRMVHVRIDPQMAGRVDPSDVVQETLATAAQLLPDYMRSRSVAFYPWLRQLAWNHLADLYRFHVVRDKRSVRREVRDHVGLSDDSIAGLASQFVDAGSSPSRKMLRHEVRQRVREAVDRLPEATREALIMRHLEQLSLEDIVAITGVSEGTVKSRLFRGMNHLHRLLSGEAPGDER